MAHRARDYGSSGGISTIILPQLPLQWRHNERDGASNHPPHQCLLNRLFRRRLKKTSKLRVTGLCAGNSPVTGEFPPQMASNAENVSIWWRHHDAHLADSVLHCSGTAGACADDRKRVYCQPSITINELSSLCLLTTLWSVHFVLKTEC